MTTQANTLRSIAALLVFPALLFAGCLFAAKGLSRPAPEFTHTDSAAWLNSTPLSLEGLRGRVVLLDFWTFDCWNCYRSFPWLTAFEQRLRDREFTVVGVHTPEFEHERHKDRLKDKVKSYGLRHPIMIDNDFSYWNAAGCRYWPSFLLVDKKGILRAAFIGQTLQGSAQAGEIERLVETLLAE